MLDVDRLAEAVLAGTKALLAKELAPLREQNKALAASNEALQKRLSEVEGREPIPGKDADLDVVKEMIGQAIAGLPSPEPVTLSSEIEQAVLAAVSKSMTDTPDPQLHLAEIVRASVYEEIKSLPPMQYADGADPALIPSLRKEIDDLAHRVSEIRMPEVIHGKDAPSIAEMKQNEDGELIVKMTTGETFNAGRVRGTDGLGFEDLSVDKDGDRGFTLKFQQGDRVKSYPVSFDVPLDRGVWRERSYEKGDGVTWAGSWWIAQGETESKPGTSGDWRLAVKAGRNGRDVVVAAKSDKPFRLEARDAD